MKCQPFLVCAIAGLVATPAAAQMQASAAPYARQLQRIVGQRNGAVVLSGVHAEGNVLVLTVNGGIGWRAFVPIDRMSLIYLARYCRRPEVRGFFNGRRMVRVDTTELGRNRWPGQPVSRCP
jgi:hypothetical protein